jgi:general stress protein 26
MDAWSPKQDIAMKISEADRNEMDVHLDGEKAIAKARELLPSFKTAMLITTSLQGGGLHVRPLALLGDLSTFGGTLWFFTDDRSWKVQEIARDAAVSLIFQNDRDSRYLQLAGTASVVTDRSKMRELYTPFVRTYFPDGLEDPHLTLLRFDAASGAFWDNPGGMLRTLAAFTKAVVTKTPGKSGEAGTMSL